jgi:regulatory helix-turn-helix LysR family protein
MLPVALAHAATFPRIEQAASSNPVLLRAHIGNENISGVNYFTFSQPSRWHLSHGSASRATRWTMQMHQIRYFLALCEELNFTRAARRSGVSQPSLTNAIGALERELGGSLFQRRPSITLTALGRAMQPYLEQIAHNADRAREAARALIVVPVAASEIVVHHQAAGSPE